MDGCCDWLGAWVSASGPDDASGRQTLRLLYHPIDDLASLEIVFGRLS